MIILMTVIAGLVAGAALLIVAMFRRDEPMLGLVALTLVLVAGFVSVAYAALDSG